MGSFHVLSTAITPDSVWPCGLSPPSSGSEGMNTCSATVVDTSTESCKESSGRVLLEVAVALRVRRIPLLVLRITRVPEARVEGWSPKGCLLQWGGTVGSLDAGAKRMWSRRFGGFGVYVMLVMDHPTFDVSATFFKESISRLIIMERYLWVWSL